MNCLHYGDYRSFNITARLQEELGTTFANNVLYLYITAIYWTNIQLNLSGAKSSPIESIIQLLNYHSNVVFLNIINFPVFIYKTQRFGDFRWNLPSWVLSIELALSRHQHQHKIGHINQAQHKPSATVKVKVKASPVTGYRELQGCETSRLPHFLDKRLADGGEVAALRERVKQSLKSLKKKRHTHRAYVHALFHDYCC
jgi:hypothetical protein